MAQLVNLILTGAGNIDAGDELIEAAFLDARLTFLIGLNKISRDFSSEAI